MIIINDISAKQKSEGLKRHFLEIEWYEAVKSVLRRKTDKGLDVGIKINSRQPMQDGQIIYADDSVCIEIAIKPCDCIVVVPKDMKQMGIICFEIGNMHLPIYIDGENKINVAYEVPLCDFLMRKGYEVIIENKKLLQTQMLSMHQIKR